jgi:hypothetical protein
MASIRLSDDIEAIAQAVSEARGLGSSRTAIEAIVRCYWQEYLNGRCPTDGKPRPATSVSIPDPALDLDSIDAAAALDQFL